MCVCLCVCACVRVRAKSCALCQWLDSRVMCRIVMCDMTLLEIHWHKSEFMIAYVFGILDPPVTIKDWLPY